MPLLRRKPRIGLALGSGSARGWAHIGVIGALEARGIKPEVVCGTSIGALVAGAYASGELERLERWVSGLAWRDVLKMVDVTWRGGLIRGQRLFDFLRSEFKDVDISALALPYGAVATELATGREVWLREGKVLDAVRASLAIPGIFTPAVRDGVVLVDGGLVNPVPVSMCRALGADIVIAVDLSWAKLGFYRERGRSQVDMPGEPPGGLKKIRTGWLDKVLRSPAPGADEVTVPSILEVFLTAMDIVETRVARSRLAGEPADVLITPLLPDFATMDFHRARQAIEEGHAAVGRVEPLLAQVIG